MKMEKIKITVEQEKALEQYKYSFEVGFKAMTFDFKFFMDNQKEFKDCSVYGPLADFTPEQFALLLCGWYEVEQPVKFEIGDWVLFKDEDTYHKIISIEKGTRDRYRFSDTSFEYLSYLKSDYEKITEQWKIMLLNLGREKSEFNKNDIIVTESEVYEAEYLTDEEIIVLFEKDLVRAFHAAEHRIEVKGNES